MKRRTLITAGLTGLGASLLAACGQGRQPPRGTAQPKHTLRMVTTWPKNFPGLGQSAERFAQNVAAATEGNVKIHVFAAGELVPALESFDAVSSGAADLYHGAEYYWQGKSSAFNFFTAIPFGLTAIEHNSWIYEGGGQALWDKLSARFGIKPLMIANTGTQTGGWFNKPITSAKDLRGLKIRAPGLGGEIYRRLGATPVTLPGSEIFPALQSGKIDAGEWIGPWNDLTFGFHQVARYCYWPGFHEPSAAISIGFNKDVWGRFSKSQKIVIEEIAKAETLFSYAQYGWQNARALQVLKQRYKVSFRNFPKRLMDRFYVTSQQVLKELAQNDKMTGEIYQNYLEAREMLAPWTLIAEQAILDLRSD